MNSPLYPIPMGLYCVPSALAALTGQDFQSVIFPAINRAQKAASLLDPVTGVYIGDTVRVLREFRYVCRPARNLGRHKVRTWAVQTLARNYPHPMLLGVAGHVVVAYKGRVYDNHRPHGPWGIDHPYAHSVVTYAALVQKMS